MTIKTLKSGIEVEVSYNEEDKMVIKNENVTIVVNHMETEDIDDQMQLNIDYTATPENYDEEYVKSLIQEFMDIVFEDTLNYLAEVENDKKN